MRCSVKCHSYILTHGERTITSNFTEETDFIRKQKVSILGKKKFRQRVRFSKKCLKIPWCGGGACPKATPLPRTSASWSGLPVPFLCIFGLPSAVRCPHFCIEWATNIQPPSEGWLKLQTFSTREQQHNTSVLYSVQFKSYNVCQKSWNTCYDLCYRRATKSPPPP